MNSKSVPIVHIHIYALKMVEHRLGIHDRVILLAVNTVD